MLINRFIRRIFKVVSLDRLTLPIKMFGVR